MNHVVISAVGCLIIFVATTFGAAIIFFLRRKISISLSSIISGFSAGIMFAASIFGLILPAIEKSAHWGRWAFVPAAVGIVAGCIFLCLIDKVCLLINNKRQLDGEQIKLTRFIIAFTVHNIPEGLAVGFALGNAIALNTQSAVASALMLAIGIAIQNIPEGLAVALPVLKATGSKGKGFLWGMLSGIVEPIFAFIGLLSAAKIQVILPWSLALSAGAMIFVSMEDLVPDAMQGKQHVGAFAIIVGFVLMMALDVALG